MSRTVKPFKYRAWYKGKMYYHIESCRSNEDKWPFLNFSDWLKHSEVMRWTGFKSESKEDIYEGDILKFKYSVGDLAWESMDNEELEIHTQMDGKEYIGEVMQEMIAFCNLTILSGKPPSPAIYFPVSYAANSKILGNIHENDQILLRK